MCVSYYDFPIKRYTRSILILINQIYEVIKRSVKMCSKILYLLAYVLGVYEYELLYSALYLE